MVLLLLDADASVDAAAGRGHDPLAMAVALDWQEAAASTFFGWDQIYDEDDTDKITPLLAAVGGRSREAAEALLLAGADPNASAFDDWSPLFVAASYGDNRMITILLDNGADPTQPGPGGELPVVAAQRMRHLAAAELLDAAGGSAAP